MHTLCKYAAAKKKRTEYSAPVLAHELGHATRLLTPEGKVHTRRMVGYSLGPAIGVLAAYPFMLKGKALGAAASIGLGFSPMLLEEGLASKRAVKGLRDMGYSEKDVAKAKKQLTTAFATYAGNTAALTGVFSTAALSAAGKINPTLGLGIGMGGLGANMLFRRYAKKHLDKKTLKITSENSHKLKDMMGVHKNVGFHHTKGTSSGAAFMPPPFKLFRPVAEATLKNTLRDPKEATKLIRQGGVLISDK